jgi:hypothetical protein
MAVPKTHRRRPGSCANSSKQIGRWKSIGWPGRAGHPVLVDAGRSLPLRPIRLAPIDDQLPILGKLFAPFSRWRWILARPPCAVSR